MDNDLSCFIDGMGHHSMQSSVHNYNDQQNFILEKSEIGTRRGSPPHQQVELKKFDFDWEDDEVGNKKLKDGHKKKLIRNRESARNSRKRKKVYIDILEAKVQKLMELQEDYRQLNCKSQFFYGELQKQLTQSQDNQNQKKLLYANLENSLFHKSQNKIEHLVEHLSQKLETPLEVKLSQMEHYFKEVMSNTITKPDQYLISCALHNEDIFKDKDHQDNKWDIFENCNLSAEQKEQLFKHKQRVIDASKDLASSLTNVSDLKDASKRQLESMNSTMEELQQTLQPTQWAKYLINIQNRENTDGLKEVFNEEFEQEGMNNKEECPLDIYNHLRNNKIVDSLTPQVKESVVHFTQLQEFRKKTHIIRNCKP